MGWEFFDVVRFELGPLLQGHMRIVKLETALKSLAIGLRILGCETKLQAIMDWKSSDVVRFHLGPLSPGQTRIIKLKCAYNLLTIIAWECSDVLDFTCGTSFNIRQG